MEAFLPQSQGRWEPLHSPTPAQVPSGSSVRSAPGQLGLLRLPSGLTVIASLIRKRGLTSITSPSAPGARAILADLDLKELEGEELILEAS